MDPETVPPEPIRVLAGELAGALPETLLRAIEAQADMRLLGRAQGPVELLLAASQSPDVLLLSAPHDTPMPGLCSHLLSLSPDLRILVLGVSGPGATLYWLGLRQQPLDPGAPLLLDQIRRAYRINPLD